MLVGLLIALVTAGIGAELRGIDLGSALSRRRLARCCETVALMLVTAGLMAVVRRRARRAHPPPAHHRRRHPDLGARRREHHRRPQARRSVEYLPFTRDGSGGESERSPAAREPTSAVALEPRGVRREPRLHRRDERRRRLSRDAPRRDVTSRGRRAGRDAPRDLSSSSADRSRAGRGLRSGAARPPRLVRHRGVDRGSTCRTSTASRRSSSSSVRRRARRRGSSACSPSRRTRPRRPRSTSWGCCAIGIAARVGSALLAAAEGWLRTQGVRFLTVKTLSATHPDPGYAATRAFYAATGFVPLLELPDLWDPGNPCLIDAQDAVRRRGGAHAPPRRLARPCRGSPTRRRPSARRTRASPSSLSSW